MHGRTWLAALTLFPVVALGGCSGGPSAEAPAPARAAAAAETRPNIVWILAEDMSPNFGSYGETTISTPNVDRLAAEGVRFTDAIVTNPICSPSRSALITGMYQTTIGAHHPRSGRGTARIRLPEGVRTLPEIFKDAGYLVLNVSREDFTRSDEEVKASAAVDAEKTDYNFDWNDGVFDRVHWRARRPGQPFFAQVQISGGKARGRGNEERWPARAKKELGSVTPRASIHLPPYLPDDPVIREDWAQYLDAVRYTDFEVGQVLDRLAAAGELDNTCVVFLTDHGVSHVRNKQFLYDGGIHVPLVIRGPSLARGAVRGDLVQQIDLSATTLAFAGLPIPAAMQGRNLFATGYQPRQYAFSARDRADETVDRIRSVRTDRYKYIRNFHPRRPYLQPNVYKDGKPIVEAMRRLHAAGKLNREQALIMAATRPAEELYDLHADPFELRNLADDPGHRGALREMSGALDRWMRDTNDRGPESMAAYDSEMEVYLRERDGESRATTRRNIELMKRWAAEGI